MGCFCTEYKATQSFLSSNALGWYNKFIFTEVCTSIHKQFETWILQQKCLPKDKLLERNMLTVALLCSSNFMAVNLSPGWKTTLMTVSFGYYIFSQEYLIDTPLPTHESSLSFIQSPNYHAIEKPTLGAARAVTSGNFLPVTTTSRRLMSNQQEFPVTVSSTVISENKMHIEGYCRVRINRNGSHTPYITTHVHYKVLLQATCVTVYK